MTLPVSLYLPALVLTPVLLLAGLLCRRSRRFIIALAPFAPMPALSVALLPTTGIRLDIPWLFFGSTLGLDDSGRIFLLLTALLWLAAGLYTRGYLADDGRQRRFWIFFLLTMSGNLGLTIALDLISFYVFFSLMSFSAYGLIIHDKTPFALRAGKIYLALVLIGEVLLFAALLLIAQETPSLLLADAAATVAETSRRHLILGLLITAFGIKIGMPPLHVWLPLAHPAAPLPASAVLSGVMIKAGLLGLLRLLPLGLITAPGWSAGLITMGLLMAFFGVAAGLLQTRAKTILAYSSISQIGFPLLGIGLGLGHPESWPLLAPAVTFYVLHHGLAKGALFLGIGMAAGVHARPALRVVTALGLLLPVLALSGAPWTSGAIAKETLKSFLHQTSGMPETLLLILLPLAALGTTLLMIRFLLVSIADAKNTPTSLPYPMWAGWLLPLAVLLLCSSGLIPVAGISPHHTAGGLRDQLWPLLAGSLTATLVWYRRRNRPLPLQLPPGDILVLVESACVRIDRRHIYRQPAIFSEFPHPPHGFRWQNLPLLLALRDAERILRRLPVAGAMFIVLLLLFLLL